MLAALRVVWFTLRTLYADLFVLVGASLVWFALNLPLWFVAGLIGWGLTALVNHAFGADLPDMVLVGALLLLTALGPSPAAAGLACLTRQLAHEELFEFQLLWAGVARLWQRAMALWLLNVAGFAVLIANVGFYFASEHLALRAVGAVFLWLTLFWFAVQLLVPALLIEQANRPLWSVLRNAAVVTVAHPLFAAVLLLAALLASALAAVLAILTPMVLGAWLSLLGARAVAELKWRYFPDEAPLPADKLEGA